MQQQPVELVLKGTNNPLDVDDDDDDDDNDDHMFMMLFMSFLDVVLDDDEDSWTCCELCQGMILGTCPVQKYISWTRGDGPLLLLMAEILHQLIGSLSHYLYGFIHPRWCRISAINSIFRFTATTCFPTCFSQWL